MGSSGDDAIGLLLGRALRERGHEVTEGGAEVLIELLGQGEPVLLLDAMLGTQAGRVHRLRAEELAGGPVPCSSHALDVPQALGLARALFGELPPLHIIGVEVVPGPPRLDPSPELLAALPEALTLALSLLESPDA